MLLCLVPTEGSYVYVLLCAPYYQCVFMFGTKFGLCQQETDFWILLVNNTLKFKGENFVVIIIRDDMDHCNIQGDSERNANILGVDNTGRCEEKFRMKMCIILIGYRDTAVWIFRPNSFSFLFVGLTFRKRASYIGRAHRNPPNTPFYIFFQQIYVLNFLNMLHTLRFFLFKMPFIS